MCFHACKINAHCPAKILVKINENGACAVEFIKTHVGHENKLEFLQIPAADKEIIVTKMAMNIPLKAILREARNTPK
jgi:hypothetical protein